MQLVSFLLLIIITMGFTIWLGRKKDWHAIFATASYAFFIVGILMLNADPSFVIPITALNCTYIEGNGTWNASCDPYDFTVTYSIDPSVMMIVNFLTFTGAFFILLIGYERLVLK